jgi:hypothetical protein
MAERNCLRYQLTRYNVFSTLRVITCNVGVGVPNRKVSKSRERSGVKRRGKPLTVYLSPELSKALQSASAERRVHKSEIVRVAVQRLLNDLSSGQLELPLGL